MNLGAKIAIIMLTVGGLGGGLFFGTAVFVLNDDFTELEQRDAEAKLALLEEAVTKDGLAMRATIGEFVQIAGILVLSNQTEIGNLTSHLLSANQVDAFAFGFEGAIIGQEFNWTSFQLENSTRPVFAALANSSLATPEFGKVEFGLIRGEERYLAASQLMSFGNQSATLIILREMGDLYLLELAENTGLHAKWIENGRAGVHINDGRLEGTISLNSIDGERLGELQVQMDRGITENAHKTWLVLGAGLIFIVAFFGVLVTLLIKRFVLNRIRRAQESMQETVRSRNWANPMDLGGNDEISGMSDQFNVLMSELSASQQEILGKNESLERYARALSHDLRSPLSTLNLNLHLLALRDKGEEIPRMQRTVKRLDEQILSILENAREQALGYVDANETVREVMEDLESKQLMHNAKLEIAPLPMVPLSAAKLRSVLQNLLENSMKYGHDGVTISVNGGAYDGGCYLMVSDNGPGISPHLLANLRDEFVGQGYGIGLATCQKIMSEVGSLDVESEEGKGATFTLRFNTKPN